MAVFDVEQQRMCLRVVYDGAASAGKTTNIRALADLFASQRTCEVFSPAEMDGRTLYFDWLQIAAGMICGFPLVCQVITVPGQVVLTPRRRHLLSTADVVVHVCDSEGLVAARALDGLLLFDEIERERGERIPLVIQANKQDQKGALSGAALLATLGRTDVHIVEAIASDSIGVVDTFVAAVRAGVRAMQARVESGLFRVAVQRAESAEMVLQKLSAEEVDPEWAFEMLLEEASNTFAIDVERAEIAPDIDAIDDSGTWGDGPARTAPDPTTSSAPYPTEHVPTGFIWPAHTGRAALHALASLPELKKPVALDREGNVRLTLGASVLSTGLSRRFDTAEAARMALVREARERTQLGSLLEPETVLVAQPASVGVGGADVTWLWSVVPKMRSVVDAIAAYREAHDHDRANALLAAFGSSLVDAMKLEAAHGFVLELAPNHFGERHGMVRYLGEITQTDGRGRDTARAVEASLAALALACDDIEPAVAALESAIVARLSPDDVAKLGPTSDAGVEEREPASGATAALAGVHSRLEAALSRGRKAA